MSWTRQNGGMQRMLSGIPAYDSQPLSLQDNVRRVQYFDGANMNAGFVDIAGNNAIGSFEQYQQPPEAWFRPTILQPSGRIATTNMGGLMAANEDRINSTLFHLQRDENKNNFPYSAPSLRNQLLHGL